ncbi:MAG: T9SS type A sorting domain-containing protein, partial [Planctomycetota bacterium]
APVPEDAEECECTEDGPDGFDDLTMKFYRWEIRDAIGDVEPGDVLELTISGNLLDGTAFTGKDCVVIVGGPVPMESEPAHQVMLHPAEPNPFTGSTRIAYTLPHEASVRVGVFDVMGRMVTRLMDGTDSAGDHVLEWDAVRFANGTYFIQLQVGDRIMTQRVTLSR